MNKPTASPALQQMELDSRVTSAMGIMVAAMLIVPMMDVLAKMLSTSHDMAPVSIVWIRFAGQAVLLALVIPLVLGWSGLWSRYKRINLARGMLVGGAVSLFFVAIKYLPLADAIAIFFVEPLVLMLLSSIFLGETVGWRRNVAAAIGFGGALMIIQPSYAVFGAKALLPLGTAILFSFYLLLSRKLGQKEHPLTMQFWAGIGGVFICSIFLVVGEALGMGDFSVTLPQTMTAVQLLAGVILIATGAHLLIVIAFSRAPASILAPFQYLEIVTMTVAGYFFFGEFPDLLKWCGIALIVGSGLYIFLRERSMERAARAAAANTV